MLLRIDHHTHYRYASPVIVAHHIGHLQPHHWPYQRVLSHFTDIHPEPAQRDCVLDSFGNWRLQFSMQAPHETLQVHASSIIESFAATTEPTLPVGHALASTPVWEDVRQHHQYQAQAVYDPHTEFVFASPYVPTHERLAQYAQMDFTPRAPWLLACHALMQRIHDEFTYTSASTDVHTPVLDAFDQRHGVCQDFAHIMVGCLRSLGLPARYVSGYLLTQPPAGQARLIGADASHAWVSVPWDGQWYDFDPTNNRWGCGVPGPDYITLAVGRDFGDVSPLRGVIHGGHNHTLEVAVTVAPCSEYIPPSEAST